MILFELKKIFKEGIVIIFILAALAIHTLTTAGDPYLPSIIFMLFLLIYASFTGWSAFDRERQEGAEEYLFSMPVSRTRLFFMKFTPRLFAVLLMLGCFHLVLHYFEFPIYYDAVDFSIFYISFFLLSLSFSISIRSFVGAFFLNAFISVGLSFAIKMLDWEVSEFSAVLIANLALLVFPISFFIAFQAFDIKPVKRFNLRFVPPLVAVVGLVVGFFWVKNLSRDWRHYYLTRDGDLMRSYCTRSQFIEDDRVTPFKGCVSPLLEDNDRLYLHVRTKGKKECRTRRLEHYNPANGNRKTLLEVEEGWFLGHNVGNRNGILKDGTYYNVLRNLELKQYKIIVLDKDGSSREIPVYGNFYDETIDDLFFVAGDPPQFFVTTHSMVYRIFENGEAEELFPIPKGMVTWKDRMLVFDAKGMTLFEISERLEPVFHKMGKIKKVRRRLGGILESVKALVEVNRKFYSFDMETEQFEAVEDIRYRPYFYHFDDAGDILHLLWVRGDELIYGRMVQGKLKKKRKWNIGISSEGWRVIRPFPSGVVVHNTKEYERYLFD